MSIEKKDFYENKVSENKKVSNEAEKLREEIRKELAFFTGSEEFYKAYPKVLITDGVKFLADRAECYWIIDLIFSYQSIKKVKDEAFQVYDLKVNLEEQSAIMICTDGNKNTLYEQRIPFTTFPLESIKLYFTNEVILLPSEY